MGFLCYLALSRSGGKTLPVCTILGVMSVGQVNVGEIIVGAINVGQRNVGQVICRSNDCIGQTTMSGK